MDICSCDAGVVLGGGVHRPSIFAGMDRDDGTALSLSQCFFFVFDIPRPSPSHSV
jgi:hypothetical protein